MSVVLMRMKKVPGNCCACELRCNNPLTGEEICPYTGVECLSIGRQALCPIIGVLPDTHGRLVDADAIIEVMKKCAENPENGQALLCYRYVQRILEEALTIVPAERREE